MRRTFRRILSRSTGDIMILMVAFTICMGVGIGGVSAIVYVFIHPGAAVQNIAELITSVINTLIGLLAGYLAGSTSLQEDHSEEEGNVPPDHP